MPRRYGRYRNKRRRYAKRRTQQKPSRYMSKRRAYARRYRKSTAIQRFGGAQTFPKVLFTKLRYNDTDFSVSTTSGAGYQASYKFRGNSVYDPDATGAGSQPYYFDQLAAVYTKYKVLASAIKVYMYTTSTSSAVPLIRSFILPHNSSAGPTYTDPNDLQMVTRCRANRWSQERSYNKQVKLTNFNKTKYSFPMSSVDNDLVATISTNPSLQWYWFVFVDTSDVAAECSIYFDVKITYYCVFYQTEDINES